MPKSYRRRASLLKPPCQSSPRQSTRVRLPCRNARDARRIVPPNPSQELQARRLNKSRSARHNVRALLAPCPKFQNRSFGRIIFTLTMRNLRHDFALVRSMLKAEIKSPPHSERANSLYFEYWAAKPFDGLLLYVAAIIALFCWVSIGATKSRPVSRAASFKSKTRSRVEERGRV